MNTNDSIFQRALSKLLTEIFDGPPGAEAYMLNPGDPGLLRQLESVPASAASRRPMPGKTTIAAHVDHVHYGFTLLNRWAGGEANPWADADWNASWQRTQVTDAEWRTAARSPPPRSRSLAKRRPQPHRMGRRHRGRCSLQRRAHGVSRRCDPADPGGLGGRA